MRTICNYYGLIINTVNMNTIYIHLNKYSHKEQLVNQCLKKYLINKNKINKIVKMIKSLIIKLV
jgi:hypothetical protein